MAMLASYGKLALKVLARRRFFTFVSLVGIAFTLTVLLVVTAMFEEMVAPKAPETRLDRTLVVPYSIFQGDRYTSSGSPGYALFDRYARDIPDVELMSIFSLTQPVQSFIGGERVGLNARHTDGNYFRILQFELLDGRTLTAEDDLSGRPAAVLSETAARRLLGDAEPVGATVELSGRNFDVVGVVRDVPYFRSSAYADVWLPNSLHPRRDYRERLRGGFNAMFLAADRGAFPRIKEEWSSRVERMEFPDDRFNTARSFAVTRLEEVARETMPGDNEGAPVGRFLGILLGGALLFMALPAINLINLNMSRIGERASEIGVRKAFGATSTTLIGQFVLENIILCLVGGVVGLAAAALLLVAINDSGLIANARFAINWRVFLAAAGLATFFGVLSGVYPAWRMSRMHPVAALKGGQ